MAAPITVRSVSAQTIPGAPPWLAQLLIPINQALASLATALNKNLTISQNLNVAVVPQTIHMPAGCDSRPATVSNPNKFPVISLSNPIQGKPQAVFIGTAKPNGSNDYNNSTAGLLTNPPQVQWYYGPQNTVVIYWVTGLAPSTAYDLSFVVM